MGSTSSVKTRTPHLLYHDLSSAQVNLAIP